MLSSMICEYELFSIFEIKYTNENLYGDHEFDLFVFYELTVWTQIAIWPYGNQLEPIMLWILTKGLLS